MDTLQERFTSKIAEPFDVHNDCWIWTASKNWKGYGQFWVSNKRRHSQAHRISYELFVGTIPKDHHVHHTCGNRACVRPDHLQVLTHFENSGQKRRNQTHCKNGHELTGDNLRPVRFRSCRICGNARAAKYKHNRKAGS